MRNRLKNNPLIYSVSQMWPERIQAGRIHNGALFVSLFRGCADASVKQLHTECLGYDDDGCSKGNHDAELKRFLCVHFAEMKELQKENI